MSVQVMLRCDHRERGIKDDMGRCQRTFALNGRTVPRELLAAASDRGWLRVRSGPTQVTDYCPLHRPIHPTERTAP